MDFFIGANSGKGFVSFFDSFYTPDTASKVFLLKGGAGSGKSTIMKKVAARAKRRGMSAELIYCPSDPDSLDAVHVPAVGGIVIDATAPHALEPKAHGVLERYVSLSGALSPDVVERKKEALELAGEVSDAHRRAREAFSASERAFAAVFDLVISHTDSQKLYKRAESLAKKLEGDSPLLMRRFLSGLTPKGVVRFENTPAELIGEGSCYCLKDSFGLAPIFLSRVLEGAGLPCYGGYCPLNSSKLEHLVFPSAKTAFLSRPFAPPEGAQSCGISLDSAVDRGFLEENRDRIRLLRRTGAALCARGCAHLSSALRLHDGLEAIFAPYTDYKLLDKIADDLIEDFFG